MPTPRFDPDAAAKPGSGIFGLPFTPDESLVVLHPVPFDATTSYGHGAAQGPAAIRDASAQVDLFDPQFAQPYQHGIAMLDEPADVADWSRQARELAAPIIEAGGPDDPPSADQRRALDRVNELSERMNAHVHRVTRDLLTRGKVPGLVGGDHSTPLGAILATAEHVRAPLGVLHLDAHMDLRDAFEGFTFSHASVMFNALRLVPGLSALVQIGLRDVGQREVELARAEHRRVHPHFDLDWQRRMLNGEHFSALVRSAIQPLPELVYVSVDIDALEPSLCPSTGTPVPGGLSFPQLALILEALRDSGRRVVAFDLVEVAPGESGEWDASVGARALYKLCALAAATNPR